MSPGGLSEMKNHRGGGGGGWQRFNVVTVSRR